MDQETESGIRQLIKRALENSWEDGKRRDRLRQVMEDRIQALGRVTGYVTVDALREGDRVQYYKFLEGCVRAFRRDGLIAAGHLSPGDIRKLKDAELARRHHAATSDLHEAFDDMSETRFP